MRALLERGRCFNSAGEPVRARPVFEAALRQAEATGLEGLAVDAAHMVAITHGGGAETVQWNRRGLALARAWKDRKARGLIPAMLNNGLGPARHAALRRGAAGVREALAEWSARKAPEPTRIAQWSVARCLRSLGRYHAALAMQRKFEALALKNAPSPACGRGSE